MAFGKVMLISVSSALLASPAFAGSLAGISIGEPLSGVSAKLQRFGEVTSLGDAAGQGYIAADYVVTGCRGRVWGVSRSLSSSFRTFVTSARKVELELRAAPVPHIVDDDGTQELSLIKLRWDLGDGSFRTLMYAEALFGKSVTESVERKALCSTSSK